jgi:hypothetical protein
MHQLIAVAVEVTPTKGLRPLGIVFLIIVSFIWPIYYYLRSAYRSFSDGLACQAPFKLGGVLLVGLVYSYVLGRSNHLNQVCSAEYVESEFKLVSLLVFGYLLLMSVLRATRITDWLATNLRRESWPKLILVIDGALAVAVELITAPWILEGFREGLQLPDSKVIEWGLAASDRIVSFGIGAFASQWLNAGQNFLASGIGEIYQKFPGNTPAVWCAGDTYQGRWLFFMFIATLLLPAVVIISFEPLLWTTYHAWKIRESKSKKCKKCSGKGYFDLTRPLLTGAQCPECRGSGDTGKKGYNPPLSPLISAVVTSVPLLLAWMLADLIVVVIRLSTGV